jgi:hypothetical protein
LLVGSMVIDDEFDREDNGLISHNCDQKKAGTS